ncbi:MAG TPA: EamA family transporter [Firmicutes bacterium]|jgi:transporter family protein|nr:EamA family transporter [Bacillota bacterium]HOQ24727.1 EamA family transporter [Bacillota bacterium]
MLPAWFYFALGSAVFAGLTALFGKIGVANISSNLATFLRTIVILIFLGGIVMMTGEWQNPTKIPGKTLLFLVLSAIATGASWLCYYRALQLGPASRVVPVDKLGVVFALLFAFVFLGERFDFKIISGAALIVAGTLIIAL